MEEAWGFTWTAQMGQVASDASDFQGDLTQWLSMQGPPQAQESPTLKATARDHRRCPCQHNGHTLWVHKAGSTASPSKAQRVDSPAPELLRIIEGNSYTNRKDPTPVSHDEQGLRSQGTWCCQNPEEPLLGRESSAEVRRWG